MTSVGESYAKAKTVLRDGGIESWEADARLLLQEATGMSAEGIVMNNNALMTFIQEVTLSEFIARRLKFEPVSRILGHRGFWKSDFKVSRETLDPRPDSETLIEAALDHVKPDESKPLRLLDLGTGTGCLILSLLLEWQKAGGIGIDISEGAVWIAEENRDRLGLQNRAMFLNTSWESFKPSETFDVIISNPPYIAEGEMADLQPDVTLYDPRQALVAGVDGLDAYRSLCRLIPQWLKPDGLVFFEIGHTQEHSVKELLAEAGFDVIETRRDLGGKPRVIVAKKH